MLSLLFAILASALLGLTWLLFVKNVDFMQQEKWKDLLLAFFLGCLSVIPVDIFPHTGLEEATTSTGIFLYYFLGVGMVEEASKFLFFLIFFMRRRKLFTDAPNFIIFASCTGMGFSAVENVLYFEDYGASIILVRGIMSSFLHIAFTSLLAFSFYWGRQKGGASAFLYTFAGFLLLSFVHGLFDYMLSDDTLDPFIPLIAPVLVYLCMVEVWAVAFNNALNHSSEFRMEKVLDGAGIRKLMTILFVGVAAFQLLALIAEYGEDAVSVFCVLAIFEMVLAFILFNRITRFVLIKDHWFRIVPSLPVTLNGYDFQFGVPRMRLKLKGLQFNEYHFTRHIGTEQELRPLSPRNSHIGSFATVVLTDKFYAGYDMIIYSASLLRCDDPMPDHLYYYLVPKVSGTTHAGEKPIAAIMARETPLSNDNFLKEKPKFYGWVVIQSVPEKKSHWTIFKEAFRQSRVAEKEEAIAEGQGASVVSST